MPGLTSSRNRRKISSKGLLQIDAFNAMWQVGLGLFGCHLLLLGYLVIRSSYVPTWLGVLLVAAGGGHLIDSVGTILVRDVRTLRARCVPARTSGPPVVLLHGGSSLGGGAATPSCASSTIGGMQPRERPETSTG